MTAFLMELVLRVGVEALIKMAVIIFKYLKR